MTHASSTSRIHTSGPDLTLVGYAPSVYTRAVRMALIEMGLKADYIETDPFAETPDPLLAQFTRFDRVPVLVDSDFKLTETAAILRYLDHLSARPSMVPTGPKAAARMAQVMGIVDADVYWSMVRGVFSHGFYYRHIGMEPDPGKLAAGLDASRPALGALEDIAREGRQLNGTDFSLADLHLAPMMAYFTKAPEGAALLEDYPLLHGWWKETETRPSLVATDPLSDG